MRNRLNKLLADNRKASARRFDVLAKADSDEAEVFLYDAIVSSEEEAAWWGGVAPESFVKALREIDASTIHLRINSPGGSVFAARAMEQALRDHKARIVVHIDGLAASAATFIAMAGDEIVMGKGALFMIHKAWTGTWGNADDLRAEADLLDKIDGTLADTYAERTGVEVAQISDWMAAETWFTADEAVEHGFADRVAETEAKAKAWNLSAYANAPAAFKGMARAETAKKKMKPMKMAEAGFLESMIEHHGMAIQMSRDLIIADPQDPLREFAEGIISAQAGEIELMKIWLEVGAPEDSQIDATAYATDEHRARQAQRLRLVARI